MKSLQKTGGRITFLAVVGALWACDIPTDAPKLEQEWILPIAGTSIDVAEFLPEDVGLTNDSSALTVQLDSIVFQETLGVLCDACQGLDGLTVPKPVFEGDFHESLSLPDRVESVQAQEGRVVIRARNGFSFDPLRPPGGERGTFSLTLRDGGTGGPILDEIVVNGEDTSFGPGTSLTRTLDYSGPVTSSLSVTVSVNSPAGGPQPGNWALIRLGDEIQVSATPGVLEASSAYITVAGEVFDLGVTGLNLVGISQGMVDRVIAGSFELEIVNPWSVGAILNFTIDGPTMDTPVILIAQIPATPSSTVEVEFSQAELQSFLGEPDVIMSGQGTVDQNAGTVTLSPGQVMIIDAKLDLVILIG